MSELGTLLEQNFFALFGLPVGYRIDRSQLASRYRELQQQSHPDRFIEADEAAQRLALQVASWINEGYTTLKSPLLRGRYLLQLRHLPMDEQDTRMDTAFLMRQMELRETLAEVAQQPDPLAALDRLRREVTEQQTALEQQITTLLAQNSRQADAQAWDNLRKMQFLLKIGQELDESEQRLVQ